MPDFIKMCSWNRQKILTSNRHSCSVLNYGWIRKGTASKILHCLFFRRLLFFTLAWNSPRFGIWLWTFQLVYKDCGIEGLLLRSLQMLSKHLLYYTIRQDTCTDGVWLEGHCFPAIKPSSLISYSLGRSLSIHMSAWRPASPDIFKFSSRLVKQNIPTVFDDALYLITLSWWHNSPASSQTSIFFLRLQRR